MRFLALSAAGGLEAAPCHRLGFGAHCAPISGSDITVQGKEPGLLAEVLALKLQQEIQEELGQLVCRAVSNAQNPAWQGQVQGPQGHRAK